MKYPHVIFVYIIVNYIYAHIQCDKPRSFETIPCVYSNIVIIIIFLYVNVDYRYTHRV
jgi:hypothetical protein